MLAQVSEPPPTPTPVRTLTWRNGVIFMIPRIPSCGSHCAFAVSHEVCAKSVVLPAPALLEHEDRMALLGQAQRADAAAEAGADHHPVDVEGWDGHAPESTIAAWTARISPS